MQRLIEPRDLDAAPAGQQETITFVRDLAVKLDAGRVHIDEIDRHTTGFDRHLAVRFTPPSHPAFTPLMRMLDRLIDRQDTVRTKHGHFPREELASVEAAVTPTEVRFPVRHPWKVKPNADGTGGVRNPAIFRAESGRGATIGSFRAGSPAPKAEEAPRPPWRQSPLSDDDPNAIDTTDL